MKNTQPSISVIIPTLNEEKNIKKCLDSIFNQEYPQNKLEVIVVDDKSTDKTIEIVKKYPVKILISGAHHGEISKMIGFKKATGELAVYLDADIELRGKNWLNQMVKPLLEDSEIIGTFTKYFTKRDDPSIERYLTFDPLQRDSIYQFFSPGIEETIENRKDGYFICRYSIDKIPPAGLCLYRRKELLRLVSEYSMFLELDFLVLLVKNGFNSFAFVAEAGLYHHHVSSLVQLIKKRKYNLTKVYLTHVQNKLYTWFDLTNPKDILKIICWIIYANLVVPSIVMGIYKSFKYKDTAGMYEPVVNFLITDILVLTLLFDRRGRRLFFNK